MSNNFKKIQIEARKFGIDIIILKSNPSNLKKITNNIQSTGMCDNFISTEDILSRNQYHEKETTMFVAKNRDTRNIIGFALLSKKFRPEIYNVYIKDKKDGKNSGSIIEDYNDISYLQDICTVPSNHRDSIKGTGSFLMFAILAESAKSGIILAVSSMKNEDNVYEKNVKALNFYDRFGFEIIPIFYKNKDNRYEKYPDNNPPWMYLDEPTYPQQTFDEYIRKHKQNVRDEKKITDTVRDIKNKMEKLQLGPSCDHLKNSIKHDICNIYNTQIGVLKREIESNKNMDETKLKKIRNKYDKLKTFFENQKSKTLSRLHK